jgi:oligo-1,6-glucosidase
LRRSDGDPQPRQRAHADAVRRRRERRLHERHTADRCQPGHTEINVEAALAGDDSVLHHYRRLIELRHTEPAVARGDFHMLLANRELVSAFTRRHEDVGLLVLANFSGEAVTVELPDAAGREDAELLPCDVPDPEALRAPLTAQPWEARVHRRVRPAA